MAQHAESVERLEAAAADWALRLQQDPNGGRDALDEWLATDTRHHGALLRAQAALHLFTNADAPQDIAPVDHSAGFEQVRVIYRPSAKWLALGGIAAGIAAVISTILLAVPHSEKLLTERGEVRSLALGDGSRVTIDAMSELDVDYGVGSRDIVLKSGRAMFRATHEPLRPFRVIVGDVTITDIGTAFQVFDDEAAGEVEVLVTEGAVRVGSLAGEAILREGQRARFANKIGGAFMRDGAMVSSREIESDLAWREGRLNLDGDTLAQAVEQMNRHNRLQIVVGDAELGRRRLHGRFDLTDPKGFGAAAALSLGGKIERDDGVLVIDTR